MEYLLEKYIKLDTMHCTSYLLDEVAIFGIDIIPIVRTRLRDLCYM